MKQSVFVRLIMVYVLYGVLTLLLVFTFSQRMTRHVMEENEAKRLYREATMIAADYATDYYKSTITLNDMQKQMEITADYIQSDIYLIDNQNRLLLSSRDSAISRIASQPEPEYLVLEEFRPTDFGNRFYKIDNAYGFYTEDVLTVFAPITLNYRNHGYVLISRKISSIVASGDSFLNVTFYTVVLVFLASLVILYWFVRSLFQPLNRIRRAAESYAKGDFSPRIEMSGHDEISYLANTLNYMAEEMDKMEEEERKFISNVSHDFRSPLTSIHGYAQAMLDGVIPAEFQEKYLKVILFEADRLSKLTQSLLDLNKFGHHGINLNIQEFDINDMIRQTIQTFEGLCYEKGLTFQLILTGESLYVKADPEKINQVIHNLVDNATKFSNHDSSIRVSTTVRNSKVFVSVKDSGIGIPADSIKKVWDRFYKTDQSRGKDQKGSGLGLTIVKEIINAHNENINVISTEGVGTEFIFTLPLSDHS